MFAYCTHRLLQMLNAPHPFSAPHHTTSHRTPAPSPSPHSNHGFDFQAWAAHGVPFLSRAEEEAIKDKLKARREREAAAAAEKRAAAEATAAAAPPTMAAGDEGSPVEAPVHTARDGTTIETLEEPEKGMVKDALNKVTAYIV